MKRWINYVIAFLVICVLVRVYFTVWKPLHCKTQVVREVMHDAAEFREWVDSIANMKTNYEEILKESK